MPRRLGSQYQDVTIRGPLYDTRTSQSRVHYDTRTSQSEGGASEHHAGTGVLRRWRHRYDELQQARSVDGNSSLGIHRSSHHQHRQSLNAEQSSNYKTRASVKPRDTRQILYMTAMRLYIVPDHRRDPTRRGVLTIALASTNRQQLLSPLLLVCLAVS